MSERIEKAYTSLLKFAGMGVNEEGEIVADLFNSNGPTPNILIGDQKLVFPCQKQFSDPDQEKIYFHPLCESVLRGGESEVLQKLRNAILTRLNLVTGQITTSLLVIAGSQDLQRRLSPDQNSLLKVVRDANEKTGQNFQAQMLSYLKKKVPSPFVGIYLKKQGTWIGKSYSRVAIITFPFYKELTDPEKKSRHLVGDHAAYKAVFEYIFPGLDEPDTYNYGTRSHVAPFLDVLTKAAAVLATRLNEIASLFKDFIPEWEDFLFDMDWLETFQSLQALSSEIQEMGDLRGNIGAVPVSEQRHPSQEIPQSSNTPAKVVAPEPRQPAPVQPPPEQKKEPTPASSGKASMSDVLAVTPQLAANGGLLAQQLTNEYVENYVRQYGQYPPGYVPVQYDAQGRPVPMMPPQQPVYPQQPMYPQQMPGQPPMQPMYPQGYPQQMPGQPPMQPMYPPGYPPQGPSVQMPPPGYPQPYPPGYYPQQGTQMPGYPQPGYPPPMNQQPVSWNNFNVSGQRFASSEDTSRPSDTGSFKKMPNDWRQR